MEDVDTRFREFQGQRERLGRVRYFHVLLSNVKWLRERPEVGIRVTGK